MTIASQKNEVATPEANAFPVPIAAESVPEAPGSESSPGSNLDPVPVSNQTMDRDSSDRNPTKDYTQESNKVSCCSGCCQPRPCCPTRFCFCLDCCDPCTDPDFQIHKKKQESHVEYCFWGLGHCLVAGGCQFLCALATGGNNN